MRPVACVVLMLALVGSALADKNKYWWLFPKFDENGVDQRYTESASEDVSRFENSSLAQSLNQTSNAGILSQLDSIGGADTEDESDQNESEGSGGNETIDENYTQGNKSGAIASETTSKADKEEDLEWTVDKEPSEEQTDGNDENETVAGEQIQSEELNKQTLDNETETDGDDPVESETDSDSEPNDDEVKEKEKVVNIDDHPSPVIEESHSEEKESSGDILDEITEVDSAFTDRDDADRANKDARSRTQDTNANSDDEEYYPGLNVDSNDYVIEEKSEKSDEKLNWNTNEDDSNKSNSSEDSIENVDEEAAEQPDELDDLLVNKISVDDDKVDDDQDLTALLEDDQENPEDVNEKSDKVNDNDFKVIDEIDDLTLQWIDEDIFSTPDMSQVTSNDGISEEKTDSGKIPQVINSPCEFKKLPFSLNLQPTTSSHLQGIDMVLVCELVPTNTSISMPYFRLTWEHEKYECLKDGSNPDNCKTVLTSMDFETNSSYTLSYNLLMLNHSTHQGIYTCSAEIYGCQSQNPETTHTSKSLYIRVYTKPNYGFHIGVISATCVLLLAILAGLIAYARRVQDRSKNRYQALLSSTSVQYLPSKVLELPNSVYNTTTTGFVRMSASSFSSKSSFTSNEDA